MSAPHHSGGQPPVPFSTPGPTSQQKSTQTTEFSGKSTPWKTIPGLGSAVKPPDATPQRTSNGGPPLAGGDGPTSLHKASSLYIDTPSFTMGQTSRNVGVMPKTAGAAPADWQSFMDMRGAMSTAATAGAVSASMSATSSAPWSLQGLGGASQSFSGIKAAPCSTKAATIHFTQTEEYHASATTAAENTTARAVASPHTAPLPQTGFSSFSGRTASEKENSTFGPFTEPSSSKATTGLNEDCSKPHSEQTGQQALTWVENANPRSLRHALRDPRAEWEESYPNALHTLNLLNPAQYVMPFGTRVVNIKTDFPNNILASLREEKYAAIEKVTERIMTIYNDRSDPRAKVIFLFSVNGSKKFCGLAEMSGEWDATGSIEGWTENPDSAKALGTLPLKWIYAKDVPYQHFSHIKQIHNGHPVGNMWNGMNFPLETGREVIECYVATSSTASILGHPRNYPENFGITNGRGTDGNSDTRSSASQRSRGSFVVRAAHRGGRGMSRGGLHIPDWRAQSSAAVNVIREQSEDDPTPTAANTGRFSTDYKVTTDKQPVTEQKRPAPTFSMDDLKNAPVADNAALLAGEPVSFIMGQDGQLMAVPVAKPTAAFSTTFGQRSSVFDEAPIRSTRFPSAGPAINRGSMDRGGRHAVNGRPPHSVQTSYASRPRHMGHGHSPSATMLSQAALFAAQQETQLHHHHQLVPFETSWNYQSHHLASQGFQNDGSYYTHGRADYDSHTRNDSEDHFDELPTPTHRPPSHATRQDNNDGYIPATYRSVQEWQSEVIQGMGHLQLKAYFFTLAAEQHILEYQSMQPFVTGHTLEGMKTRMARIVELKRAIYDELNYIGHTLDGEDFNRYQYPEGYPIQQRVSPVRDDNGRILPSASETSRSPTDTWVYPPVQPYPQHSTQLRGHQQQQSTQSAVSMMMGGGVHLNERHAPS